MSETIVLPRLAFSYSQFIVYDETQVAGCDWTDAHVAQGFARRESTVSFGTLLEFGHAEVRVSRNPYVSQQEYERVIAVPFRVVSGRVIVKGPEEAAANRRIDVPPGAYRLVAAQYVAKEREEAVDIYFEALKSPLAKSAILVADPDLEHPPEPLIESAELPGG